MLKRVAALLLATTSLLAAQAPAVKTPPPEAPTPLSFFGHAMGQDRSTLEWDKVVSYFQALARVSSRIRVEDIGRTTEDRRMIAAFIASPGTLKALPRFAGIQQRLADPRKLTEADANHLIASGKTVVMITCSVHSNEVASTHSAVEMAWRLVTGRSAKTRAILDNTILILVPSLNPDGIDIVTSWYRKTLGTPYEGTIPPDLYQKYIGHDNNRDWYIFSQVETRNVVSKLHNVWHPQIVYDVHEQGPYASRIFVPPWMDPIDPNVDPIIAQLANMVGMGMAMDLTSAGRKGVAVNGVYDFWSPSRHYQAYHAGARILSESASVKLATPVVIEPDQIASQAPGYNPKESSWNYLEPWLGGEWHLRDIVDDQLVAMESCLYTAATRREDLLRSFYQVGRKASSRSQPYAFVIPGIQFDPGSSRRMLETLAFGQVEIERAGQPFEAGGKKFGAGTYVIRMQQPYSSWAKTLLERQNYPGLRQFPGGPPLRPYDVTAQTLPLLMGVDVDTVNEPFEARLSPVRVFPFRGRNRVPAGGLAAEDVDSWREVNRLWTEGKKVFRDQKTGDFFPEERGDAVELKRPRIGLYRSWIPVMDEGWTRWLLENFNFAYQTLRNSDIQAGELETKYDVIVFPSDSTSSMANGFRLGAMPEEYVGGIGQKGAQALRQFVDRGGHIVFLNQSTAYATDLFGVPADDVTRGLSTREFYVPGSLLNVTLDPTHPLAFGLPEKIAIWSERSPAFKVPESARVVARYEASNLLASGWLLGESYLAERAAIVDVPLGQGRVILFGMRPQYRAQSYRTFKIFFNSLVY